MYVHIGTNPEVLVYAYSNETGATVVGDVVVDVVGYVTGDTSSPSSSHDQI